MSAKMDGTPLESASVRYLLALILNSSPGSHASVRLSPGDLMRRTRDEVESEAADGEGTGKIFGEYV